MLFRSKAKKRIIGSPHYVAPEMIKEKKSTAAADWWALGIILFEMLMGSPPYDGSTPDEVLSNIVNDHKEIEMDIGYSDEQISPDAATLIEALLERNVDKRLQNIKNIRDYSFFQGVDWTQLRQEEAPFVPHTLNEYDTSYFSSKKIFAVEEIGRASCRERVSSPV